MGVGGSGRRGSARFGSRGQLEAEFVGLRGCFGVLIHNGFNQLLLLFQSNICLVSGHGRFPLLRGSGVGLLCGLTHCSELGLCKGTKSRAGRTSARGGMNGDPLVLLRNSATVGGEAGGRSGDGKYRIYLEEP